jgi:hypothetical protein
MISGTGDRERGWGQDPASCAGQAQISHRIKAAVAIAITI